MDLDNYEEDLEIADKIIDRHPTEALLILLDYKEYFDNTFDSDDIYFENPIGKDIAKMFNEQRASKNQIHMDACDYYFRIGYIYFILKNYSKAEANLTKASLFYPYNSFIISFLSLTKIRRNKINIVSCYLSKAFEYSKDDHDLAFAYNVAVDYFNETKNKEAAFVCLILSDIYNSNDYKQNRIKEFLGTDTIDDKYYEYDNIEPIAEKYKIPLGYNQKIENLVKNCLYSSQQDNDLDAKKYYLNILSNMEPDYIDAYNKLNKGEDVTLDLGECEYIETSYRDFYPLEPKKKKYITRGE